MNDQDHKDIGLRAELGRKAIHVGALVMPIGLWFVPREIARPILLLAFLVSVTIDVSRWGEGRVSSEVRRIFGAVLRPHESSRFSGATYILAAAALCATLYDRPVAVAAMIFIILGDTAAVFVGRYLGRIRMRGKTLEGSLGFFAAALLGVVWISQLPVHVMVIGALTAAVVEALPGPIDDNLSAPVVSGSVMTLLLN